jgi:hypothetical protein
MLGMNQAKIDAAKLHRLALERLALQPDNKICFDCGASKVLTWASVNNGVFLCFECLHTHRGYGVHVSWLRSVNLDLWSDDKVALMTIGGNKRANDYLISHGINPPSRGGTLSPDIYIKDLGGYRNILKLHADYYLKHGHLPDEDKPNTTETNNIEVPSLLKLATKAFCKTNGLNDQIMKRNADFLRPRIIEHLISQRKLFGDKISILTGNFITSLELDGAQLNSSDISTIARSCPELQSFTLTLFTNGDLSQGLSALICYCYKLTSLKIEFSVIKLDPTKLNQAMTPFSINLQELSFFKSIFEDPSHTFPALEDVLFLCNDLKKLTLSKDARNGASIEIVYPFVKFLPKYEKIVELADL